MTDFLKMAVEALRPEEAYRASQDQTRAPRTAGGISATSGHAPRAAGRPRPWIQRRADELTALVTQDSVRARVEFRKHLDGDLELVPGVDRQVELRGRVSSTASWLPRRLLAGSRPALVAGAGYAECYTVPATYWVDLVRQ